MIPDPFSDPRMIMPSVRVSFLVAAMTSCLLGLSCKRGQQAKEQAAAREYTDRMIDEQLQRPSSIGGQPPDSIFIKDYYLPGLKRAKTMLGAMQAGRIDTFPIAAYILPRHDGDWFLWMDWLQTDTLTRTADLFDDTGVLAKFDVPMPDNPYPGYTGYLRIEQIRLRMRTSAATAPSRDSLMMIDRPPNTKSLHLRINSRLGRTGEFDIPALNVCPEEMGKKPE